MVAIRRQARPLRKWWSHLRLFLQILMMILGLVLLFESIQIDPSTKQQYKELEKSSHNLRYEADSEDVPETAGKDIFSVDKGNSQSHDVPADSIEVQETSTVAYAVSFIKCGDFQTNSAGLVDASLILRHSIHKISSRNPESGSKYDYKMYAIVHPMAKQCFENLQNLGFEVVLVDPPIQPNDIRGAYLRQHIHKNGCCGHDEFVKLYAYTLPEDIIVHVDIDFAFYKPMDHLFDAILYDKDSIEGKAARQKIELERPNDPLPDKIGAFITRDWPQVAPGKFPPAFQAGFLVARRDPDIMDQIVDVIKEGNYTEGWGVGYGWGNSGHGGYVGAMAVQGVVAYFYDFVRPNNAVELNQCRYNHMGMDVRYRHHPNYTPRLVKKEYLGGCRNTLPECEDCMMTDMEKIYSVHYTQCRKPWQCMGTADPRGRNAAGHRASAIPSEIVNPEHCYMLVRHWHELRSDFEKQLFDLTGDETIWNGTKHEYRKDIFLGHCSEDGNQGYQSISGKEETFHLVPKLYG